MPLMRLARSRIAKVEADASLVCRRFLVSRELLIHCLVLQWLKMQVAGGFGLIQHLLNAHTAVLIAARPVNYVADPLAKQCCSQRSQDTDVVRRLASLVRISQAADQSLA